MSIGRAIAEFIGRALRSARAGNRKLASRALKLGGMPRLSVTSSAFGEGKPLPESASADGAARPPEIHWSDPPQGTRSFALVCEDPDAPLPKPFVHWLAYGIPRDVRSLDGHAPTAVLQGKNTKQTVGYTGAAPPPGHGVHHYHFQVFALDCVPDLKYGVGRSRLLDSMREHVLAWGETVGTYQRG